MNNRQIVRIDELKMSASDIKNKKDLIMNIYEKSIKKILDQSEECIRNSGKDYDVITNNIKNLFFRFDTSITELTDVLTNIIIPNYEDIVSNISRSFNSKFASDMKKTLELEDTNEKK